MPLKSGVSLDLTGKSPSAYALCSRIMVDPCQKLWVFPRNCSTGENKALCRGGEGGGRREGGRVGGRERGGGGVTYEYFEGERSDVWLWSTFEHAIQECPHSTRVTVRLRAVSTTAKKWTQLGRQSLLVCGEHVSKGGGGGGGE